MSEPTSAADNSVVASARIATLALIPSAVAFNIVVGSLVRLIKVPIYLDCIGGIVTTLIAGLAPGVIVAVLSQTLVVMIIGSTELMWYTGTAVAMSLCAWFFGKIGGFKTPGRAVGTGLVMGFVSATVSFPITYHVFGNITSAGSTFVTAFYTWMGFKGSIPALLSGLTCDPVDKISETLITVWLIRSVPAELLRRFRGGSLDRNFQLGN
jgi:energy-coupling factor transport system substrate-specific component